MAVTYMVTVESEGFSADWLDDVIVVAANEAEARAEAEQAVIDYRGRHNVAIKDDGTEVYPLGSDVARVVGILVPRDER